MTRERDAQIFLGQVYDVTEQLAVNIESGEITVADARVTCVEGIASAFGFQVNISASDEADEIMPVNGEALPVLHGAGGAPNAFLKPGEAAGALGVSPKTLNRWAKDCKITPVITLGGHRRYRPEDVRALAEEMGIL